MSSRGPRLTFPEVGDDYPARITDLKSRRAKNLAMGGEEKIAKQHQRGKLTVRERLDLLFDKNTFVELGLLAHQQPVRGGESDPDGTPADGGVTGHGPPGKHSVKLTILRIGQRTTKEEAGEQDAQDDPQSMSCHEGCSVCQRTV